MWGSFVCRVILYLCECGTQKVVKTYSTLYNQVTAQCEETNWRFDYVWVVSLEVKFHKSSKWWVNHNEGG
jgi:hypothetical protein